MASNQIVSKEHMAIVAALKDKYLGKHSSRVGSASLHSPTPTSGHGETHHPTPSQEVHGLEIHPTTRETVGREHESTPVDEGYKIVMESVDRAITASFKPSLMINEEEESRAIEAQIVTSLPPNTQPTTPHELAVQSSNRGRWFAVVLRIEFDPACLSLDYKQKAELAGLRDLSGEDDEDLVFQYQSILNDKEFVANRKTALEAFEAEMDIPTAVCIAKAAKTDPSYAIMRRRLRQMEERYRVGGDQREQFGQIMSFLHGNNGGSNVEQGLARISDEAEDDYSNGDAQLETDRESV